jgi:cell division initiation protein
MIDLTPLDVRNKRGDFKKALRGYEPQEVDTFLELVSERLEFLVRENLQLKERSDTLAQQVNTQSGRERAVQEALVTAQELRADIRAQAQREAELILEEANASARRKVTEAEGDARARLRDIETRHEQSRVALDEMERRRVRFLKAFRQLLERELDVVAVEQGRTSFDAPAIDLDLAQSREEEDEAREPSSEEGLSGPPSVGSQRVPEFDPTAVDDSADERPPYDAPVDRLAELYTGDGKEPEGVDAGARAAESDDAADDREPVAPTWRRRAQDALMGGAEPSDDADEESAEGALFRLPDFPPPPKGEGNGPGMA